MKKREHNVIVVSYFLTALFVPEMTWPPIAFWIEAILALAFVLYYVHAIGRHALVPLMWVLCATFILPMGVLTVIGLNAYPSLIEMHKAFMSVEGYYSPLALIDMLIPFAVAVVTLVVATALRSNSPVNTDASRPLP